MGKIKRSHKALMIYEAGFIYCKRHDLNYERFDEDVLSIVLGEENVEYDNICDDLRKYRYYETYKLVELTEEEYDLCVSKFGESK